MLRIDQQLYSSKNHKQIMKNPKTGKPMLIKSSAALKADKQLITELNDKYREWEKMVEGREFPYRLNIFFLREENRTFDYVNICQQLFDCMTKAGYWPDDDMKHLVPIFRGWKKDQFNPGAVLWFDDAEIEGMGIQEQLITHKQFKLFGEVGHGRTA